MDYQAGETLAVHPAGHRLVAYLGADRRWWTALYTGGGFVRAHPDGGWAVPDFDGRFAGRPKLSPATLGQLARILPDDSMPPLHPDQQPLADQLADIDIDTPADDDEASVVDGATFVLDEPAELVARWGKDGDVLWAQGESLLLCGPTGVGKTTIAGQLIGGLIGVLPDVLGYPVAPAKRILYLAMDRPRQIQRALRRLFAPEHRAALAEHLVVRRGPLPADIGRKPELLVALARRHHADILIVDSLKDAAVKLSDDDAGGNINRAVQMCNALDIDVLILHHQRKGQEGKKPTTLDDVYGNSNITNGSGSVVLLWGEAGSELVELSHLKQPAEPVGPLSVEHDHHAGTSRVTRGWDALAYLTSCGAEGATIAAATQAHHGAPQTAGKAKWKQTERRLRALVKAGLATSTGQPAVGEPGRFYAIPSGTDVRFCVDTPRGLSAKTDILDIPVDNPVDNL